jgi:kynureninase
MNFQNTKEFAKSLDAQDELNTYKNEFYFPQHNNKNVIYFTGNSLGLQPKITKKYVDDKLLQFYVHHNPEHHFHLHL